MAKEGTSSQGFHQWFVTKKYPALQAQSAKQAPDQGRPPTAIDPLVRASATASPEQLLLQVRRDPAVLAASRQEWIKDAVENDLAAALNSSAYHEGLRRHYDDLRAQSPKTIPYTFDQYLDLQKVRPEGAVAFGKAVEKINPTAAEDDDARTRADFEAAKKRELFQEWWSTSAVGKFVRRHVNAGSGEGGVDYIEKIVTSFLNVPVDLATALLLSLFICIDFPRLKRGVQSLRETWLRDVYDELAPVLYHQAQLIGRAMYAQGLIALCNAVTLFLLLSWLGIEHTVLLCLAVFVLCLVPTLGTFIAWILIAAMALIQPGGGLMLALKATGAVLVVVALETFVFSPRILGRMMEVHPVLLIALLPLAQYFFGIWGLLLATPVAVYVIHVVILRHGLPGSGEAHKAVVSQPANDAKPPETGSGAKERVETTRAVER